MVTVGSAFVFGWNLGVTNNIEEFIKCFMQNAQNQTSSFDNITTLTCRPGVFSKNVTSTFATFASILCIGAIVGGPLGTILADNFGRKICLALNTVVGLFGFLILYATREIVISGSLAPEWFTIVMILGRFISGINAGIGCAVAPVYLNEIAPSEKRGLCGLIYPFGCTVGILCAQLVGLGNFYGSFNTWNTPFLIGCFPIVGQMILLLFSPETPDWLESHGKSEKCKKVKQSLYGNAENTEGFLEKFENTENTETERNSFMQNIKILFQDIKITRAVLAGLSLHIIQQMSGVNAISFYSTNILRTAGFDDESSGYGTCFLSSLNILGTLVASGLIEKKGRKPLMIYGCIGVAITMIGSTILLSFESESQFFNYIILADFALFYLAYASGPGCIPWTAGIEFVQTEYKTGTAALSACVNFGFTFLVAQFFPILEETIGHYVFLVFGFSSVFSVIYLWKKIPESKDKEPEIIQDELEEMWRY